MRFLIDADLPRSVKALIESYGHSAVDVRDIGLGSAPDPDIAAHAAAEGMCLVTGDWGFSDVRHYPPSSYPGLVVIGVSDGATPPQILVILRILFDQPRVLDLLPGRLAVVDRGRVRLRPPP
jgi:predicted nuclease of predicted toxin-antitoxin system